LVKLSPIAAPRFEIALFARQAGGTRNDGNLTGYLLKIEVFFCGGIRQTRLKMKEYRTAEFDK
jgi:hypothetical protein